MEINILQFNGVDIAELVSSGIEISKPQDAVDLMAKCMPSRTTRVIVNEKNIIPEFFDLKTKIAGEILQKFATYRFKIAIVGDFSKYESNALKDFIYESNKHGEINFVGTVEEGMEKLAR
ncbi:MAG: DUF4180 domain-containing protein [Candidatus Paceibacterota bacterium]|jgi:hypothetical protein|nr:DUF4180 domain-containing protein [bacterium]